jgi:hypothetical protein
MTQWIETEDGYVNAAHVVSVKETMRGDGWVLRLVDGDAVRVGRVTAPKDFGEAFATILPAQPGQEALLVTWDDHTARPTELWLSRMPIIGWRVRPDPAYAPVPIIPENELPEAHRLLIVLPDGKLLEPGNSEFDNVEVMQRHVLDMAQAQWDGEHAAKMKLERERADAQ